MDNQFIPQGIKLVTEAIEADNAAQALPAGSREQVTGFEAAHAKYTRSLEYFMTGLKYEKNPSTRDTVKLRVEGYLTRAEALKKMLDDYRSGVPPPSAAPAPSAGAGGAAEASKTDEKEDEEDAEKSKLRGALAGAVVEEKPNVKWDDVAGLEGAKEALREAVILPAKFPQLFTGKRKPWKGILLYGPPGTGKSYLAKAVATECDAKFYCVSSSDLVSKWQGESERLVRNLFEMARENKPSVIFIDEIDSLCSNRSEGESDSTRRIKTEFLVQMQGVGNNQDGVLVLGATNVPWELDPAMRRRFEKRVYIALPEAHARAFMFRLNIGDTPNNLTEEDFQRLGELADGCSGSDINAVVRDALMEPLRKCQTAKQFRQITVQGEDGPQVMMEPCASYPNCTQCPPDLTNAPVATGTQCAHCGAIRTGLYDLENPEMLRPPDVCMADFEATMGHGLSSVAEEELEQFVNWTTEFGQDG